MSILIDMAHDCAAVLLNKPEVRVADVTLENLWQGHYEAVLTFTDGSTLMNQFDLPDDTAPFPAVMVTLQSLLMDTCKNIEATLRELPTLGHTIH